MTDLERRIQELNLQLQDLRNRQMQMSKDMFAAQKRLQELMNLATSFSAEEHVAFDESILDTEEMLISPTLETGRIVPVQAELPKQSVQAPKVTRELEDFIGTNVISKIGILVTIIGVFIGAKYAIDNELISPVMRIVAGYIAGGALLSLSLKLKRKYLYFSSILVGGGLAIMYFITYIAFSFYALFPQSLSFIIMVITTFAAVGIALWYDQKVIALLGQVAAYAIPFLLGDGKGNVFVLFAYISLINVGLLILSFKKDWKVLYHIAFFLTWFIYGFWVLQGVEIARNFTAGIIFLGVNFSTFYVTFLAYKIIRKEQYQIGEIAILLVNALLFFLLGANLIDNTFTDIHVLTWFTIINAIIHFVVGFFIYRLKLADTTVFQFIAGLGLLFITIAIPIELDGSWVTLLWTIEGTTLFYIAHKNNRHLYLEIAAPVIMVAFGSIIQDWLLSYPFLFGSRTVSQQILPFVNFNFYCSLFVCACLFYVSFEAQKSPLGTVKSNAVRFFQRKVPLGFFVLFYFTLFNELYLLWDQKMDLATQLALKQNLEYFRDISSIIFSMAFVSVWMNINRLWLKREDFHELLFTLSLILFTLFLFDGLLLLGNLRESYLTAKSNASPSFLYVRYLLFTAVALLWFSSSLANKQFKMRERITVVMSAILNITLLSVIANEFIHWMDLAGYQNQYKLGLSLIAGGYALAILFIGILKKRKHLRLFSMVLFAITLVKLFLYDLVSLSTISKTVVLVLLGALLLVASFLYNKYKEILFGKEEA